MLKLENYSKIPLSFETNQGQNDPKVKFLSRGRGYTMFLTAAESVLLLRRPGNEEAETKTSILRMTLSVANQYPQVLGLEELPGKANYFIGNDPDKWCVNIPTYSKIKYNNVYPGVDMICYGNQQQLEYDFVVSPGVDPNIITLDFQGADQLEIDDQGNLVLHSNSKQILLHKPYVYQDMDRKRHEIPAKYLLKNRCQVSFQLESYDATHPLVIDPILDYSTYLGGSNFDRGNAIAVDPSGNAYITGETSSTNFPTANPFQPALAGSLNAFVTKINASGSALVYSTYLGGSNFDRGNGIAVDSSGNAYITGETSSTNFPTANPFQPALAGSFNAFVTKINASGSALVYSTYLGGSFFDEGYSIAVDSSGNAYVTGRAYSLNFPTANPLQPSRAGISDAFVTKINPAGSALVYSTYLGGIFSDSGNGIAVDSLGNAYVTGYTSSTNFPTANPLQLLLAGSSDAFVTKINPAGSALVYSTYLGGSNYDAGDGIAVDSSGNAYVTGRTDSINFPTSNPLQPSLAGDNDIFVTKINASGSALVYSTYLGGSNFDRGWGIAVDSSGNAYVAGETNSTNFPTVNPLQPSLAGSLNAFVTKINTAGSALVYSTYLGGSNFDRGNSIAVDFLGNAYMTGETNSTNFPTANPLQPSLAGSDDAFVAKISEFELTKINYNIQVCLVIKSTKEVQLLVPSYGFCGPSSCDAPAKICPPSLPVQCK